MKFCKCCLLFLILLITILSVVFSMFIVKQFNKTKIDIGVDYDEPLFLTPLIMCDQKDIALEKSRVYFPGFSDIESYSGFLTISQIHDSNLFFWYFPSRGSANDPVLLWLQGGPGSSSLWGAFYEHGPFKYFDGALEEREYTWIKNHHVLYIDNPVQTGFSFTKSGFAKNQTIIGNDLYLALEQFFLMFPDLKDNDFFVAGESYGGKYVVALCNTILLRRNNKGTNKINLKGFAIGNGWFDPVHQIDFSSYLYNLGLIDENGYQKVLAFTKQCIKEIKAEKWTDAFKCASVLLYRELPDSLITCLTNFNFLHNVLNHNDSLYDDGYEELLERPEIRRALHVGNKTFHDKFSVRKELIEDMMKSVAPWLKTLLSHYRGLVYSGQLDILVFYTKTAESLRALNFSSAEKWKTARREPWYVGNEFAGYSKTAGNLTEVLVRNAGHAVPVYQPKWAMDLITRFTRNKPLF